jgi:hypothetical protein
MTNHQETPTARDALRPEFIPLPQRGHDPYFGISRSSYYDLERRGIIRLVRLRKPGQIRGKVLIPFAETAAALRKLGTHTPGLVEARGATGGVK